ncbi:MAG: M48 family metalloprotease [Planctomycetota bacterium]
MFDDLLETLRGSLDRAGFSDLSAFGPSGIALLALAGLVGYLATALGGRVARGWRLRRIVALPWPEQARHHWAMAKACGNLAGIGTLLVVVMGLSLTRLRWSWDLLLPAAAPVALGIGTGVAFRQLQATLRRPPARVPAWRSIGRGIASTALIIVPWVSALLVMLCVPLQPLWLCVTILATSWLIIPWWVCVGLFHTMSRLGLDWEPDARLRRVVDEVSEEHRTTAPRARVVSSNDANAAAAVLANTVFFTEPILALPDDELAAITGHELGHLRETGVHKLLRAAPILLAFAAVTSIRPVLAAGGPLALLALGAGTIALAALTKKHRRTMELRADAAARGAARDADDPRRAAEQCLALARALESLHRMNLVPVTFGAKKMVHPDLIDRMRAAGLEPTFAIPEPPRKEAELAGTAAGLAVLTAAAKAWLLIFGPAH